MFFVESLPWCGILMQVIASPHPCRVHATLVDKGDCGQGAVHKVTKGWFTLPLALEGLNQLNHIYPDMSKSCAVEALKTLLHYANTVFSSPSFQSKKKHPHKASSTLPDRWHARHA